MLELLQFSATIVWCPGGGGASLHDRPPPPPWGGTVMTLGGSFKGVGGRGCGMGGAWVGRGGGRLGCHRWGLRRDWAQAGTRAIRCGRGAPALGTRWGRPPPHPPLSPAAPVRWTVSVAWADAVARRAPGKRVEGIRWFGTSVSNTGGGFNWAVGKFVWTNFEALPRTKYFLQF